MSSMVDTAADENIKCFIFDFHYIYQLSSETIYAMLFARNRNNRDLIDFAMEWSKLCTYGFLYILYHDSVSGYIDN